MNRRNLLQSLLALPMLFVKGRPEAVRHAVLTGGKLRYMAHTGWSEPVRCDVLRWIVTVDYREEY